MRLLKEMVVGVPVRDPIDYGSQAPETFLRSYLVRHLVNRCYRGCMVTGVREIRKHSRLRIDDTNLDAHGTVNVQFVAEVVVLGDGDIVTDVEVTPFKGMVGGITRRSGGLAAILNRTPGFEVVRKGDRIPVRVVGPVSYKPKAETGIAVGELLTCRRKPATYAVKGAFTPDDAKVLARLAVWVRGLLAERAALPPDAVAFFEDLLYPFAGKNPAAMGFWGGAPAARPPLRGAPPPFGGGAVVDLLKVAESGVETDLTGTWGRPDLIPASSPFMAKAPPPADAAAAATPPPADAAAAVTPLEMVEAALHQTYNYLQAVNELATGFADEEKRASHAHVWGAMRGAQRES